MENYINTQYFNTKVNTNCKTDFIESGRVCIEYHIKNQASIEKGP